VEESLCCQVSERHGLCRRPVEDYEQVELDLVVVVVVAHLALAHLL
jgi:hypothetical protein